MSPILSFLTGFCGGGILGMIGGLFIAYPTVRWVVNRDNEAGVEKPSSGSSS